MEQKIAPDVEHRLTRAIEKAASLMAVSMDRNPNELIAGQLKQANVDKKFARVAAQAFNKRATVIHLSKTADEHKADDFPLADPDTVYELCGGVVERPLAKAASVVFEEKPFVFAYVETAPAMAKAAAVAATGLPPYEYRVDVHVLHDHIESVMDKCANEFRDMNYEYNKLEKSIKERADGLARWFNKTACQSFEFTTAAKLFGQDLKRALGDRIPDVPLEKSASVVNPGTPAIKALGTLLEDMDKLAELKKDIVKFGKDSMDFIKTAAAWGEEYTRAGGKLMDKKAWSVRQGYDWSKRKVGEGWDWTKEHAATPAGQNTIDSIFSTPIVLAELGTNHTQALLEDAQNMGQTEWNNAMAKYYAGLDRDVSPGKVLDAQFINQDRLRDRMMAISDLSADRSLAAYPFKDVFRAANIAMDSNLALERPDRREILRAYVAQLLPQNNRAGLADLAALGSVMDSRRETQSGATAIGENVASKFDKEKGPEYIASAHGTDWLQKKDVVPASLGELVKRLEARDADDQKDKKDTAQSRKEYDTALDNATFNMLRHSSTMDTLLRVKSVDLPPNRPLTLSDVYFRPNANGEIDVRIKRNIFKPGPKKGQLIQVFTEGQKLDTLDVNDIRQARETVAEFTKAIGANMPVDIFAGGEGKGKKKK